MQTSSTARMAGWRLKGDDPRQWSGRSLRRRTRSRERVETRRLLAEATTTEELSDMAKVMKIKVPVVIELDPQDWADEYGLALEEVREDVRSAMLNGIQSHLNELFGEGVITAHLAR